MADRDALRAAAARVHDEADDWLEGCWDPSRCEVCTAVGESLRGVALDLATQAIEMEVRR